ncbi:hypothetical protein ACFV7Q_29560 [Streptomyces sp. NPDC059851]|uniref:hypothetical protein n=1 Tax=Streptomyces sp. NPDC059851 TaxID=3346971 RepID=UPI00366A528E
MTQNSGQGQGQGQGGPGAGPGYPGQGQYGGWGGAPQWGYPVPTAPQPGVIPLRPLALGEILSGAFGTISRHGKQLAGVMLAVMAIVLLVMGLAVGIAVASVFDHFEPVFNPPFGEDPAPEHLGPLLVAGGVLFVVLLLVGLFGVAVLAALCPALLKEAVTGRPTTFRALWRASVRRTPAVTGAMILAGLIAGLPVLAALAVGIAVVAASATDDGGPALLGLVPALALAALPVTVWLTTRFGLSSAVVVLEGVGPVTALRRSAALVRGDWWRIFGISLLGGLIAGAIGWVMQMPFNFISTFALVPAMAELPEAGGPSTGTFVALGVAVFFMFLGGTAGQMFQIGFSQLVSSLLYVDQRIRREGLAEAILADLAADPTAAAPTAGPTAAGPAAAGTGAAPEYPAPPAPPQAGGSTDGR